VAHLRSHDPLTGLPDRATLEEDLSRTLRDRPHDLLPLATLVLDVDEFDEVNDVHGHAVGDEVLTQLARRLRAEAPVGAVVGRLDSDAFGVVVYNAHARRAHAVALDLLRGLEEPFHTSAGPVELSATIGIATYPEHGDDVDSLLRNSRVALDLARAAGTHLATFAPEQDARRSDRRRLVSELRDAIDAGELTVVYQPIVEMSQGRVVAVEALARWRHPTRGHVPPSEFVELAERSGLIRSLTRHVMRVAVEDMRGLALPELELSVNISTHDVLDARLHALVEGETSRPKLRMEVTESALMADASRAASVLAGLRDLGVSIAVDDFGTGHSSLAYLELLPVDQLKIDRSFVIAMHRSASSAAIVRATIQLAHALGLTVVAEGVEDEQAWGALAMLGCELAQGFHIARPMTIEELREWLRRDASRLGSAAD
jgi:diguanylate cyclase (GGDEF)-like protein